MKYFVLILPLLISVQAFAIQNIICTPAQNSKNNVEIVLHKNIDPAHPFIGPLEFGAVLSVHHPIASKSYKNNAIRIQPEVYTTDLTLRGDSEVVHLRLYPHFDNSNNFTHYTGQLFINDSDTKTYFNYVDHDGIPGLSCR